MEFRSHCILSSPTPCVVGVNRFVNLLPWGWLTLSVGQQRALITPLPRPLRPPLPGQRSIAHRTGRTGRSGDAAPCWGYKWWKRRLNLTTALAPGVAACFLWRLVGGPDPPHGWWLLQWFALGCQAHIGGNVVLEVLESKSFINQAKRMPWGGLPGRDGFVDPFWPRRLPCWGHSWGTGWGLGGGRSRHRLLAQGRHPARWGERVVPSKCLEQKSQTCML